MIAAAGRARGGQAAAPSMKAMSVPQTCPTSQAVFDADLRRLSEALKQGGYVRRGVDRITGETFSYVTREAPEALIRPYQALLCYGAANGLI